MASARQERELAHASLLALGWEVPVAASTRLTEPEAALSFIHTSEEGISNAAEIVGRLCDALPSHDPPPAESCTMRSSKSGRALSQAIAKQRENTAETLVYLAEADHRRLHEGLGYGTMLEFCVAELKMCDEDAAERIEVARAARAFPVLFDAIAEGRLQLAGVRLLAPHLTAENVDQLVAAMTHRTETEIVAMLAEWFPGTPAA
jgi:hypothetical protein